MNAESASVQPVLRMNSGEAFDVVLEIASETSGVIAQEMFKRRRTGGEALTKVEKTELAQDHIKKILAAQTADKVWSGMSPSQKTEALLMFLTDQTMNNG